MKDNAPFISIIIPCYNVSGYVEKAVQSILDQTYPNLEIFIIDDASTDDTLQKINSFNDNRIKVITFKENTKKVGAVNEVLKKVNGNFIAFQDADDWSEPNRIEDQMKEFEKDKELGICFTRFRYKGTSNFKPSNVALTNEELRNGFLEYNYQNKFDFSLPACSTMMISKEVLQSTGGYNLYFAGRVAEDIHWIYRILKKYKGITIDKILYNYYLREGSFTQIQAHAINAKYAYSWQLLSKIIYKDIHEGIDVLNFKNREVLQKLELDACEEALVQNIQLLNKTRILYENSLSFKIGKFIISPWRLLKSLKNKR